MNELNLQEIDIISSQLETNTHYYTVKPSEYNTNCAFCGSTNIVKYGKTMRKLLDLPVRDEKIIIAKQLALGGAPHGMSSRGVPRTFPQELISMSHLPLVRLL